MKKVVYLFFVILLALVIIGCRSVKYVPVETVRYDSIAVRDTMMEVKLVPYKDSISTSDTVSFLSNPYAYSWARYSGGMLHHSLGIWTFATTQIKVPYFIDRYHYEKVPQIVEVEKKLTRWQQFKLDVGGWVFTAVGIYILYLLIRLFIQLKKGG